MVLPGGAGVARLWRIKYHCKWQKILRGPLTHRTLDCEGVGGSDREGGGGGAPRGIVAVGGGREFPPGGGKGRLDDPPTKKINTMDVHTHIHIPGVGSGLDVWLLVDVCPPGGGKERIDVFPPGGGTGREGVIDGRD